MASALIAALPALGSALGGIFGGAQQNNQLKDLFSQWLNRVNAGVGRGEDIFNQWSGQMWPALVDAQEQTQRNVLDRANPMFDWSEFLTRGGADLMRQWSQAPTETAGALGRLEGLGGAEGPFAGIGNTANAVFQGGGWTPQYQQFFDTFGPMMGGQTGTQQNVQDIGNNLLSMRGQTAQSQAMQDRMMDELNRGGWNPRLAFGADRVADVLGQGGSTANTDALTQAGLSLLQGGGLGPEGNQALRRAISEIDLGGQTAQTQGLIRRGLDLAGVNALQPLDVMQTMAREDARRAISARGEEMRRQAAARGGAGSVVGSGIGNDILADFADASAEAQGAAVRDATRTWQDAAQRQQQIGGQLASTGMGTEGQRLGTFGNMLAEILSTINQGRSIGANVAQGGEGLATQRLLGALQTLPSYQGAATGVMGTLGNLGLGASGQEIDRMNLGGNLTNQYLQSLLGAGGLFNQGMGNQNQYALGAGSLGNTAFGNQLGANNMWLQGLLSNIGLGQQMGQQIGNFTNQSNRDWQNMFGMNSNNWANTLQGMGNMANAGLNYAGNWASGINNAYGGNASAIAGRPNPWGTVGGMAGGILGSLIGMGRGSGGGQGYAGGGQLGG